MLHADEGPQIGDILFFSPPKNPSLSDRFIQFAQRKRGISHPQFVHAAIVVGMDGGQPIISHIISGGLDQAKLSSTAYAGHEYTIMRANDLATATALAKNAASHHAAPVQEGMEAREAKKSNYSIMKMIAAFIRGSSKSKLPKSTKKKLAAAIYDKDKTEEICSSYVASVVKHTCKEQGYESSVTSSYLLPGNLFETLKNSQTFDLESMSPKDKEIAANKASLMQLSDAISKVGTMQSVKAVFSFGDKSREHKNNKALIEELKQTLSRQDGKDPAAAMRTLIDTVAGSKETTASFKEQLCSKIIEESVKLGLASKAELEAYAKSQLGQAAAAAAEKSSVFSKDDLMKVITPLLGDKGVKMNKMHIQMLAGVGSKEKLHELVNVVINAKNDLDEEVKTALLKAVEEAIYPERKPELGFVDEATPTPTDDEPAPPPDEERRFTM